MSGGPVVRICDDGDVRRITLDRPERRNALNQQMLDDLDAAFTDAASWRGRVVVLEGAGKVFSAGADLQDTRPAPANWSEMRADGWRWNQLVDRLEALPQVTVARLHGHVIGGGLVLALACDLRIAEPGTAFKIPELSLGVSFAMGGVGRLVREVGLANARMAILTGRTLTVDEVQGWGLLHHVGDTEAELARLIEELRAAPEGVLQMTKHALRSIGRMLMPADLSWADPEVLAYARTQPGAVVP